MKKYFEIISVKPEHAEEYIALHNNPWPEMVQAEIDAGMHKEVIFFHDNKSFVYCECEDYDECYKKLRTTEIYKKWEETVGPWMEGSVMPRKVFDLMQQHEGELLPN